MKINLQPYRSDKSALVSEIERATTRCSKNKGKWLCPFHNENSGSLGISEHEGTWHFKCFGCGKSGDVFDMQAHNEKRPVEEIIAELSPREQKKPEKPDTVYIDIPRLIEAVKYIHCKNDVKYEAEYTYTNPQTKSADLIVFRLKTDGGKRFLQATAKDGGFVLKNRLEKNPIYNRARVQRDNFVVVVEGEKKVHCLHDLGIVATCSPGGANAAAKADWSPLAGKTVTIWPDNDDSGTKYAEAVLAELRKLNPRPTVKIVDVTPLNLEPKDDVVDFCARYPYAEQKRDAVWDVLNAARGTGAIADLEQEVQDAIDGKRYPIDFPWHCLSEQTYALTPGSTMMLCGNPGGRKSLMVLQFFRHFVNQEVPTALFALEDGVAYQLRRLWAQICEERLLTSDVWCKNNPDLCRQALEHARAELSRLEPHIESKTSRDELKPAALIDWVKRKCDAGKRVLIIDPITKMAKGKLGFLDDEEFLDGAQMAVEKAKASIILVTHPRKATQKGYDLTMDDLAGGVAFRNFGQCIVYLQAHEEETVNVATPQGVVTADIENTVVIFKARNSSGAGKKIGFRFNRNSLTLTEQGVIQE